MISIDIKVEDKEIRNLLSRLQAKMNNLTPAMKEIGQIIRNSVLKNFQVGGRPAWKPSKRALREGGQTLRDTGRL